MGGAISLLAAQRNPQSKKRSLCDFRMARSLSKLSISEDDKDTAIDSWSSFSGSTVGIRFSFETFSC